MYRSSQRHARPTNPLSTSTESGDALALLQALPECTPLVWFDPQYREIMDKLKLGNEGARQRRRFELPSMTSEYIDDCCREAARILRPSGYLMLWSDTLRLVQGYHLRATGVLQCVDLIVWDNQRMGQGKRSRRRGSYLVVLQKPPIEARPTWRDRGIPDRWVENIEKPRSQHPHIKPVGLIKRLIGATTKPGDLVVDPAAGSFVVLRAAHELGREFVGCDIAYHEMPLFQAVPRRVDFWGSETFDAENPNLQER